MIQVVLDANLLISTLVFSQGALAKLRLAWQAELFRPLAAKATIQELMRVWAYPKFNLKTVINLQPRWKPGAD